ncbi:hypothetical protein WICMUC_004598 [Wickerhamomyces mucosus]|uniref:triacylglycerol lipase n=1 Tax=Wickerhamomyces mucosus TaxID=1378264 RepID=A0A9P8TAU6_9ASCO|nr:hypothetical protein WICMUC_004598 [Wickerhamomyces mucosus]
MHTLLYIVAFCIFILSTYSATLPIFFQNGRESVSSALYWDLVKYAHLIDISYCISRISKIHYPFECDNSCSDFPNTELVYQWNSDDLNFRNLIDEFSTSGYIALNHDWKKLLIVIRGTRSFKDSIVDLNSDLVSYGDDQDGLRVHKGFYCSYLKTWNEIKHLIKFQYSKYPDYGILIMGHSMGGAIASFLTLKLNKEFDGKVFGVTMGQPMIGNDNFTTYMNHELNLKNVHKKSSKLLRITHKNDPVIKLPWRPDQYSTNVIGNVYTHSSNEVFINDLGPHLPEIENVYHCIGSTDLHCSYGKSFPNDNTEHLNYFRRMGKCGLSFFI